MAEITETTLTFTDSENRFMKCVHVILKVFPQIMQRIMEQSSMSAEALYVRIHNDKSFKKELTQKERKVITTLLSDGYSKLDLTLILKIIRHYSNLFVYQPTRGWHSRPNHDEVTIDNDAQRLRLIRNHFLHQVDTELSETDCNEFFSNVLAISERVDQFLNCPEEDSFWLKIQKIKMQTFITTQQLKAQYDEERCLEDFFVAEIGKHEFRVYKAKSFKLFVEELRENWKNHSHESSPTITLTIPSAAQNQITSELREEINKKLINIKVVRCRDGSLVMDIVVKTSVLLNDKHLESELRMLFTLIFTMSKDETWNNFPTVPVIMSEDLYCFGDDQSEDMGDETPVYSKGSLKLNLEVDNNILQSDELLKSEIKTLFDTIVSTPTEKIVFPTEKPVVSVIEPCFRGGSHGSMYSYLSRTDSDKAQHTTTNEPENQIREVEVESLNLELLNRSDERTLPLLYKKIRFCTLPNGRMVVFSYNDNTLIITKTDGTLQSTIALSLDHSHFNDITYTDGNCVAFSSHHPQVISIIDVIKKEVVKEIKIKHCSGSITFQKGNGLYCTRIGSIVKLDIDKGNLGNVKSALLIEKKRNKLPFTYSGGKYHLLTRGDRPCILPEEKIVYRDDNIDMYTTIASTKDRICCSYGEDTVTVLDSKYNVIYKCENLHIRDITIDHHGIVYIINRNNISAISPDDETVRHFLDEGIIFPTCVHYDRHTQQLLVVAGCGTIYRYSIKMS